MSGHRKKRTAFNIPGHAHELTFSTYRRRPIFNHQGAAELFLDALAKARRAMDFELWAFVVMPDHCHVLLKPRQEVYSIADILRAIKSPAAKAILAQYSHLRDGLKVSRSSRGIETRIWQQGGGYDRNICVARTAALSINHIHMNPVRRGLCETPGEWPWSSSLAYAGGEPPIAVDCFRDDGY